MSVKTCCCIGHRKIEVTDRLKEEVFAFIENLIVKENVKIFLLGSRSDFDGLCHGVITDLKKKYPFIKRIGYTCKHETVILENEREKWEKIYSHFEKREVHLLGVEEEFSHKTKFTAGKAAYVERNTAMIDDSDFCLFYYDDNYLPDKRKRGKKDLFPYQPKSGTAIAYEYAVRKKKSIKNFYSKT